MNSESGREDIAWNSDTESENIQCRKMYVQSLQPQNMVTNSEP